MASDDQFGPPPRNPAPQPPLLAADGTPRLPHIGYDDDGYPHSDNVPMTENTWQADQIFYAFPAIQTLLRERQLDAFAAADMFLYPRKGDLKAALVPHVLVAFGVGDYPRSLASGACWRKSPRTTHRPNPEGA